MPFILKIILSLSVVLILLSLYVSWRIIGALGLVSSWNRICISGVTLAITSYLLIYPLIALVAYLSGSEYLLSAIREGDKIVDYLLMYPFWIGLIFILQVGVLFFCLEIIRFFISLISKSHIIRLAHTWLIIMITGVGAVYVPAKIYLDTKTVKTEQIEVRMPNLPEDLDGFKIAHISDLQADNRTIESRMEKYIDAVNELEPDIAVFTGDLVTYGEEHIERGAEMMGRIRTKYGVYACLGDHDYWSNPAKVARSLSERGVIIREDEDFTLGIKSGESGLTGSDLVIKDGALIGNKDIHLTFVTNIYHKRPDERLLKALANQDTRASLRIFITHQPSQNLIEFAAKNDYDIFLAGHTHGGQVVIPLLKIKLTPVLFETSFLSGQYRFDSMFVNINNGLGLTFSPVRYNSPATVTLLKLKKVS